MGNREMENKKGGEVVKMVSEMENKKVGKVFVGNAFSVNMLPAKATTILFRPISVEEAKEMLKNGFESAVGHDATAKALTLLLHIEIKTNRVAIKLDVGDKLIVFTIKQRLNEGQVIKSIKELEEVGYDLFLVEVIS